jgi:predicted MFS family arabinose efflux permease
MLGNFATGLCILAPAGMLPILADGVGVGIREAGLLVTYGAVILCFGSPIVAWLTTRIDRRTLLVGSLGFIVIGQAASAFAPNYATVLVLRLAMVAGAAVFTPQAAGTIALLVPEKDRSGAIAFVFLGWSLAVAGGLPLITFVSAYAGWRGAFAVASLSALVPAILLMFALPRKLLGPPLSLHSFNVLAHSRKIILLLLITILPISGQLIVFVYLAPLLQKLTGAGHEVVGLMFALFGVTAFIGNVIATNIVGRLGGWATSGIFLTCTLSGLLLWSFGVGYLPVMGAAIAFMGLGFAATNSMQQARLVQAGPDLASASVALNTSGVYVGQAIGSGVGGVMSGIGFAGAS